MSSRRISYPFPGSKTPKAFAPEYGQAFACVYGLNYVPEDFARAVWFDQSTKLGEGGQAEVLALSPDAPVLIKATTLRSKRGASGAMKVVEAALQETWVRHLAGDHPRLASPLGRPFLTHLGQKLVLCQVLPRVQGVDLESFLRTAQWDARQEGRTGPPLCKEAFVRSVLAQLVVLVATLHALGLAHRDLKPANVMLDPDTDAVYLIDFGFCDELGRRPYTPCSGTLNYMPPELLEQLYMFPDTTHDMFAVGMVAYEMMCGMDMHPRLPVDVLRMSQQPGHMKAKVQAYVKGMQRAGSVYWPAGVREYYRQELVEVVEGLLHLEPEHRLSAEQVVTSSLFDAANLHGLRYLAGRGACGALDTLQAWREGSVPFGAMVPGADMEAGAERVPRCSAAWSQLHVATLLGAAGLLPAVTEGASSSCSSEGDAESSTQARPCGGSSDCPAAADVTRASFSPTTTTTTTPSCCTASGDITTACCTTSDCTDHHTSDCTDHHTGADYLILVACDEESEGAEPITWSTTSAATSTCCAIITADCDVSRVYAATVKAASAPPPASSDTPMVRDDGVVGAGWQEDSAGSLSPPPSPSPSSHLTGDHITGGCGYYGSVISGKCAYSTTTTITTTTTTTITTTTTTTSRTKCSHADAVACSAPLSTSSGSSSRTTSTSKVSDPCSSLSCQAAPPCTHAAQLEGGPHLLSPTLLEAADSVLGGALSAGVAVAQLGAAVAAAAPVVLFTGAVLLPAVCVGGWCMGAVQAWRYGSTRRDAGLQAVCTQGTRC